MAGNLRTIHRVTGIAGIFIFFFTGYYMATHFPDIYGSKEFIRFMFRANHTYILLSALLNFGIGAYIQVSDERWRKNVQVTGSILIVISTILLVGAFFYEPANGNIDRPITLPAILFLFIGALLHMISVFRRR